MIEIVIKQARWQRDRTGRWEKMEQEVANDPWEAEVDNEETLPLWSQLPARELVLTASILKSLCIYLSGELCICWPMHTSMMLFLWITGGQTFCFLCTLRQCRGTFHRNYNTTCGRLSAVWFEAHSTLVSGGNFLLPAKKKRIGRTLKNIPSCLHHREMPARVSHR